jgi:hypothetical protein
MDFETIADLEAAGTRKRLTSLVGPPFIRPRNGGHDPNLMLLGKSSGQLQVENALDELEWIREDAGYEE